MYHRFKDSVTNKLYLGHFRWELNMYRCLVVRREWNMKDKRVKSAAKDSILFKKPAMIRVFTIIHHYHQCVLIWQCCTGCSFLWNARAHAQTYFKNILSLYSIQIDRCVVWSYRSFFWRKMCICVRCKRGSVWYTFDEVRMSRGGILMTDKLDLQFKTSRLIRVSGWGPFHLIYS